MAMRPAHVTSRRRPNSATAEGRQRRGATPGRKQGGTPSNGKDAKGMVKAPAGRAVRAGAVVASKAVVTTEQSEPPPSAEVEQDQLRTPNADADGPVIPPFPENTGQVAGNRTVVNQDQGSVLGLLGRVRSKEGPEEPQARQVQDESFVLPSPVSARLPSEAGASLDEETRLHCTEGSVVPDGPCPDEALTNLGRMEALSRAMAERCERLEEELKTKDDALQELAARLDAVSQPVASPAVQLGKAGAQAAKTATDARHFSPRPGGMETFSPGVTPVLTGRTGHTMVMSPGRLAGLPLPVNQVSPRVGRAVTPRASTPPPGIHCGRFPIAMVPRPMHFSTPIAVPSRGANRSDTGASQPPLSTQKHQSPLSPSLEPSQPATGQATRVAPNAGAAQQDQAAALPRAHSVGAIPGPRRGAPSPGIGVVRLVSDGTSSSAGYPGVRRQQSVGAVVRQRSGSPHTVVRMPCAVPAYRPGIGLAPPVQRMASCGSQPALAGHVGNFRSGPHGQILMPGFSFNRGSATPRGPIAIRGDVRHAQTEAMDAEAKAEQARLREALMTGQIQAPQEEIRQAQMELERIEGLLRQKNNDLQGHQTAANPVAHERAPAQS
eukprot:gnl/MRDRNA2_/MRDRNA2_35892_c0_seq1.p1 gnl/MRDRNA2_/MRDRNA2_35892_c0~~gnl/MRDRNA2_/MRDRNA2_35892_c0_seq1.p1  ORF type:complete len:607 (+),score=107.56 gnl/MRDRNA2_/MRDRNA2_35892_c0_seq1:91-1911(+)